MKALYLFLALLCGTLVASAQSIDPQILVGSWKIDLRPTPDAEPYYQHLVIDQVGDGTFSGTFYYDSEITSANINVDWNDLVIAFVTADNSGFYNTTARYEDGILKGTTHSIGRNFLSVWTAVKEE
jgi:hypothetical protein